MLTSSSVAPLAACRELEAAQSHPLRRLRHPNSLEPLYELRTRSHLPVRGVKQRAESWRQAGETERSSKLLVSRKDLMLKLSTLENSVYAVQTNKKEGQLSVAELQQALTGVIEALDVVIAQMGCEARWKSGACEILALPENRNFRDLIY